MVKFLQILVQDTSTLRRLKLMYVTHTHTHTHSFHTSQRTLSASVERPVGIGKQAPFILRSYNLHIYTVQTEWRRLGVKSGSM